MFEGMLPLPLIAALLLFASLPGAARARPLDAAEVAYEDRGQNWAYIELVVNAEAWKEDALVALSKDVLVELTEARLAQVRIYAGERIRSKLSPPLHAEFADFLRYRAGWGEAPYAELFKLDGDAVLRFKNGSGPVRRLISGRDPTRFTVGAASCEIVYLTGFEARDGPSLKIFVVTAEPLTTELGVAVSAVIRNRLPLESRIYVRNDLWFFSAPYAHPFLPRGEPPAAEQWNQTWTVYCPRQAGGQCYAEQRMLAF
jgi:hypothetical protein